MSTKSNITRDPFRYAGKRVVVTGCSSGIGKATAQLLAEAGACVIGVDLANPEVRLDKFIPTDLRDLASISAVSDAIGKPVDALFNCAGLPPMRAWSDVMLVNFIGMRALTEAISDTMESGAAIVSVSSNGGAGWRSRLPELLAFVGTASMADALSWCEAHEAPQTNAYGFSKEAVIVWTQAYSAKTIARGIRLNCTSPGAVQTPMLDAIENVATPGSIDFVARPIGRRSSAAEQAWALLALNSEDASYINGVDLPVDGGFAAARLPGLTS